MFAIIKGVVMSSFVRFFTSLIFATGKVKIYDDMYILHPPMEVPLVNDNLRVRR